MLYHFQHLIGKYELAEFSAFHYLQKWNKMLIFNKIGLQPATKRKIN